MSPTPATAPPIRIAGADLGYAGHPVVRGVDWTLSPGSMTALVGPNGGGKSTLLKAIAGELQPLAGRIDRDDHVAIAYLPQAAEFDRSFPIRVKDIVAMGLWHRLGPFGQLRRQEADTIAAALRAVGLVGFGRKSIGALSGGELQRVLFARLIVLDAPVILLDEPFAAIDQHTVADLMEIIRNWNREGRTIVAALHDLDQVRALFPEAVRIAGGTAIHGATATILGAPAAAVGAERTSPVPA